MMKTLQAHKDEEMPLGNALSTLALKYGYTGNDAQARFLTQLNLGSIVQGGGISKGLSRALSVLDRASSHTPLSTTDSYKAMWVKANVIHDNMLQMEKAIGQYEKRYPGLGNGPAQNMTPPPTNRPPLSSYERK